MSITLITDKGEFTVTDGRGSLLTEVALRAGLKLNTRCGEKGVCGGCAAKLEEGEFLVNGHNVELSEGDYQVVLACHTQVLSESARIVFPRTSLLEREAKIEVEFRMSPANGVFSKRASPVFAEDDSARLGVAVDIGTTTVVAMLVNRANGEVLGRASMYNQQIIRADDVASRISYAASNKELHELQRLVIDETINALIDSLCTDAGVESDDIRAMTISGNTVMTHLFLGISPESIGRLPFTPVIHAPEMSRAKDLGVAINPDGSVDCIPAIAGYVGGDITSNIHVSGLLDMDEPVLLVDIGTNGEIVFGENGKLVACATAAGPAFEGYGTTCGCRAAAGAVEHMQFDETLAFEMEVIGNTEPEGICGSGVIDFIACGLQCGLISRMGRFDLDLLKKRDRYLYDEEMCGKSHACVLTISSSSKPVFISEMDISQIMKAKAAVYSGMKTLLESQGKKFTDLSRFYLAGGFARHIHLPHAIMMGLLPEIPIERFEVVGNGSLAGAFLALTDARAMDAYRAIYRKPEVIELNLVKGFESHFIDALALPHLSAEEFSEFTAELNNG